MTLIGKNKSLPRINTDEKKQPLALSQKEPTLPLIDADDTDSEKSKNPTGDKHG
jgi:hypothetical protein